MYTKIFFTNIESLLIKLFLIISCFPSEQFCTKYWCCASSVKFPCPGIVVYKYLLAKRLTWVASVYGVFVDAASMVIEGSSMMMCPRFSH